MTTRRKNQRNESSATSQFVHSSLREGRRDDKAAMSAESDVIPSLNQRVH